MTLRYLRGADFDSKKEAEQLMTDLAFSRKTFAQLCSVIDIVQSVLQSRTEGFLAVAPKWDRTVHEDLFLYLGNDVAAAINVPGNGRAQTYDLTLIGVRRLGDARRRRGNPAGLEPFLREMRERRKKGQQHDWE